MEAFSNLRKKLNASSEIMFQEENCSYVVVYRTCVDMIGSENLGRQNETLRGSRGKSKRLHESSWQVGTPSMHHQAMTGKNKKAWRKTFRNCEETR
jgi:hypothetical protein